MEEEGKEVEKGVNEGNIYLRGMAIVTNDIG